MSRFSMNGRNVPMCQCASLAPKDIGVKGFFLPRVQSFYIHMASGRDNVVGMVHEPRQAEHPFLLWFTPTSRFRLHEVRVSTRKSPRLFRRYFPFHKN